MRLFIATVLCALLPFSSYASVIINEVMYNLEGTDSDREWIEVKNTGSSQVNLSDWKFYENGSNHNLEEYRGGTILSPGGFAVISDVPDVFLTDWPNYSGILLDSSWSSFSNTGETLSLKNEDGDIVNEVSYSPEDGADGDGNSLQLIGGEFVPGSPTPGLSNQQNSPEEIEENEESDSSLESGQTSVSSSEIPQSSFGVPSRVFSGEEIKFTPTIFDNNGDSIFKARFVWSFGDGVTREDTYRKDFSYTYIHPGTYVIHLSVFEHSYSQEPDHVYRQTITVLEPSVAISLAGGGVELKNGSVYEVDLGGWKVSSGLGAFSIPPYTILLPGKSIIFSEDLLDIDLSKNIFLRNSEGFVVDEVKQQISSKETPTPQVVYRNISTPTPVQKIVSAPPEDMFPEESQLATAVKSLPEGEEKKSSFMWYITYIILVFGVIGVIAYIYFKDESDFINEISGTDRDAEDYTFE